LKICVIEFLGGPHDGASIPVAEGTETMIVREGHTLHRYDLDEVNEGPKVRRVFRCTGATK
jgi:hypothetical protein